MKKILIFSPKRSGSTFFRHILNSDNRIDILNETHFLSFFSNKENEYLSKDLFLQILLKTKKLKHWFTVNDDFSNFIESDKKEHISYFVDKFYQYNLGNSNFIGDKTPEYIDNYGCVIDAIKPDIIILFLRDPLYITESLRKRKWEGNTPFKRANYLNRVFRKISIVKREWPDSLVIKYEILFKIEKLKLSDDLIVDVNLDIKDSLDITVTEANSGLHNSLLSKPSNKNNKFIKSELLLNYNKWLLKESYLIYDNRKPKFQLIFLVFLLRDFIIEIIFFIFKYILELPILKRLKNTKLLNIIRQKFYTK